MNESHAGLRPHHPTHLESHRRTQMHTDSDPVRVVPSDSHAQEARLAVEREAHCLCPCLRVSVLSLFRALRTPRGLYLRVAQRHHWIDLGGTVRGHVTRHDCDQQQKQGHASKNRDVVLPHTEQQCLKKA
jgi:hypothetical protein